MYNLPTTEMQSRLKMPIIMLYHLMQTCEQCKEANLKKTSSDVTKCISKDAYYH